MEAPLEITGFTLNKANNDLDQEKHNNNNENRISREELATYDQQEFHQNHNTDYENNIVIVESPSDSPKKRNTVKDFQMSYILGKGSYAKVVLATNIYTDKQYALKIIDKIFLGKVNSIYHVKYQLSIGKKRT